MKLIPTDLNNLFFPPLSQIASPLEPLVEFMNTVLKRGDSVLVGLSGGSDSVALLLMLKKLEIAVGAFYLNHHIRSCEEASGEEEFVQALCRFYKIPLYAKRLPEGFLVEAAKQEGSSLEAVARRVRYEHWSSFFSRGQFDWMASAHHQDDEMETQVMRFFSAASVRGLGGISSRREKMIRPLLTCRKIQLLEWLEKSHLPYLQDSTNENPLYLRNRIRLQLMPLLETIFPGLPTALGASALKMELQKACNDFYLAQVDYLFALESGEMLIDWNQLRRLPLALQVEAVIQWVAEFIGQKESQVPWRMVYEALNRTESAYGVNRELFSFNQAAVRFVFRKEKKFLHLQKKEKFSDAGASFSPQPFFLLVQKWEDFEEGDLVQEVPWLRGTIRIVLSHQFPTGEGVSLPLEFLKGKKTVELRSWQPGDTIITGKGSSRLKKIFNSWKLSAEEKKGLPVVVVDGQVMALLGSAVKRPDLIAQDCFRAKKEESVKWLRILFEKCCLLLE